MSNFYEKIDSFLGQILTGECLTLLRKENSDIISDYEEFQESKLLKMNEDFGKYLTNYLTLRNYKNVSLNENTITALKNDGSNYDFSYVFDYAEPSTDLIKLKILDKGLKFGISLIETKYIFIVSINKKQFYLLNCEKLKQNIKDNIKEFKILTEDNELFKTKYIELDLGKLNEKILTFNLK